MKPLILGGMVAALLLAVSPGRGAEKIENRLNARVHDVNDAAKKKGMMQTALHSVSVETGVPQDKLESLHHRFPDLGPGGLLVSCVMAAETKKAPEEFIKKHNSGDGWGTIARENRVPEEKLIERLDHVEQSLAAGGQSKPREKR